MLENWPIIERMKVTEDGRVLIDSQEHIFLTATTIPRIHEKMLKTAGIVANTIVYNATFNFTNSMVSQVRVDRLGLSNERYIDILFQKLMELGIGKISWKVENENFTVKIKDSFESEVHGDFGKPMCYMCSGAIAGIISGIYGITHTCIETRCVSKGDPHCEFLATREDLK